MTAPPTERAPVLSSELPRDPVPLRARTAFEAFVIDVEPRLRAALVALYGTEEGRDATAEALAWAWEHWPRVMSIEHPAGFLFRVAQSRSRRRRQPVLFVAPEVIDHPFEPKLPGALRALPERQRVAVVLVHGLGYSVAEVAELLSIKPTTVRNHLERGLRRLRRSLGVDHDAE
jgi:DNA-directed RNA polymerase specialized sigma24 family protein